MSTKRFIAKHGLDNNSQTITSVADPVNDSDAATKGFAKNVDNHVSGTTNKVFTATEQTKLSGIATNANNYSLPVATTAVLGGVKDGTGVTIDATGVVKVDYGTTANTAVQGNDTRVTADRAAATASIRTIGTGALQAAAGNHNHTIDGLSNVVITTNSDKEVLAWDSTTSKWINQTAAEIVTSDVLGTGTADSTTFLSGDRTWKTVTGGATLTDDTTTDATYYPTFAVATSGTMTTAKVASTKLKFNPSTGTLESTTFNSTSDARKKTDVQTASGVDIINQLRGVEFNWLESDNKSSGVIAQEIEAVIPHVVATDDDGFKSVNYNGIIAYLIEAVKEQSNALQEQQKQIDELKTKSSQ